MVNSARPQTVLQFAVGPIPDKQKVGCFLTLESGTDAQLILTDGAALDLARTILDAINQIQSLKWELVQVGTASQHTMQEPDATELGDIEVGGADLPALTGGTPVHAEHSEPAIEVAVANGGRVRIPGSISPDLATAVLRALV